MKYRLVIDKNAEEEIVVVVHAPSALTREIEEAVSRFSGAKYILGEWDGDRRRLDFSEIEVITVLERRVIAIDDQGRRYRIWDRLRDLEKVLPSCFIRINKSTLANENAIERFSAAFSGGVDAVFKCGYKEYVSRRCFAQIRRRYEGK